MSILRSISLFTVFWFLIACNRPSERNVIFTFDDHYIESWYASQTLFSKYGIKATFYVNRPGIISAHEAQLLKQIELNGHEIGCHGMNHINAEEYVKKREPLLVISGMRYYLL